MKTYLTILRTELKLSLRGVDMLIFAICMPVVVFLILGAVFGSRPAFPGASYTFLEQSFGAVTTISICAGGVMGLPLVISDYRSKKILKRLKVTPVSPVLLLIVQVSVYTLYSLASLLLVYAAAALFFGYRMSGSWPLFLACYALVMFSTFSIGMLVGGIAPDSKTAGVIASLLYFPMLIFSGATLPLEVMPEAFRTVVGILPLTQGITLLKAASLGLPLENVLFSLIVILAVGAICTAVSLRFFRWE